MVSYSRLIDALGAIPDPRRAQGRRFPLPYLLLFSVLAILSGAKSFTHIVIFMRERREILNQVFGSRFKTAPSINTVRLLLHAIGGAPPCGDRARLCGAPRDRRSRPRGSAAHRVGWQDPQGKLRPYQRSQGGAYVEGACGPREDRPRPFRGRR